MVDVISLTAVNSVRQNSVLLTLESPGAFGTIFSIFFIRGRVRVYFGVELRAKSASST